MCVGAGEKRAVTVISQTSAGFHGCDDGTVIKGGNNKM